MRLEKTKMRKRIYEIIELADQDDRLSDIYDSLMLVAIIFSLLPLAFKTEYRFFVVTDRITTVLFLCDYNLRWLTADYKQNKKG